LRYRPEIDGLRAIAVIPVILFHAGFKTFSGGFVGVDVFFVISGYLITSIIISDLAEGKFSLANFYERRARRILPALLFVMAVCVPFAWLWLMPRDMKDFSQSLVAVSTFSSNLLFYIESDYFDTASELKPLLHTWSLAVEEQYYILFPLFLILTWRLGKRWIIILLALISLLSLSMTQWGALNYPEATFYLLPTRGWEILSGACVAFYLLKRNSISDVLPIKQIISLLGLSMIFYAVFMFDKQTPFPSLFTLVPTVGTILVILFTSKSTIVFNVLSKSLVVGIGLISYSAYLWHQPIFAFTKYLSISKLSMLEMAVLCVAAFPLAYLSWRYIEVPFRKRQVISTNVLTISSVTMLMIFIGFGISGHLNNGFIDRSVGIKALHYVPDNRVLQKNSWNILRSISLDKDYGVDRNTFDNKLWFNLSDRRTPLLIVGNSHSKDLFNVLFNSETAKKHFQIARYGVQLRYLVEDNHSFFSSPNYKTAQIIMLATKYSGSDVRALKDLIKHIQRDNKRAVLVNNIFEFRQFAWRNLADYEIAKLKTTMNLTKDNKRVAKIVNSEYFIEYTNNITDDKRFLTDNAEIEDIGKELNVTILDKMDYICSDSDKLCYAIDEEYRKYFFDYGHHTLDGAKFFGKRVDATGWLENLI